MFQGSLLNRIRRCEALKRVSADGLGYAASVGRSWRPICSQTVSNIFRPTSKLVMCCIVVLLTNCGASS
jgi:hypothetical protein